MVFKDFIFYTCFTINLIVFSLYSNIIKSPVPERGEAECNASTNREDPLLQNKKSDIPPCEEVPSLKDQESDVTHHVKDSSVQHREHSKECDVPPEEELSLVPSQENDVPPQERDSLPQPQEHYQQFNMPPHEEVPLYQAFNVPPFEKDYFLQQREHYQTPVYQSSMHSFIPNTVYGLPVPSQNPYMLHTTQMFPLQPQPPGLYTYLFDYALRGCP